MKKTPYFSDGAVANLVGIIAVVAFGVLAFYGVQLLHDFIAAKMRVMVP